MSADLLFLTYHRRTPSWKVASVNTEETIMEGHMHEHGPLYTSVPLVMFYEGDGWVGVWVVVWMCGCVVVSGLVP